MYSERQKVPHTFEDTEGRNPLGACGSLVFELDVDTEDGDEFCDRTLTVNSIRLLRIETDDGIRAATDAEADEVGGWFWRWLESRPGWGEMETIENAVFGEP